MTNSAGHNRAQGTQTKAACRRRDELSRDQLDDKLDYTNRAQGTLASASTKELTVATISLTGCEPVGRLNDHFRAGAKALLVLQLGRLAST